MRRFALLLLLLCVIAPLAAAASKPAPRLAAAINRGYFFPEDNPACTWTCAAGNSGATNAGSLSICRSQCAASCHATCQILF